MISGLSKGACAEHQMTVTGRHLVPAVFASEGAFADMPAVFATAYMVGLMEWACVEQLAPFLEDGESSLGIHVDVNHVAPTLAGQVVTVKTEVEDVDGRFIWFRVQAHDGADLIGEGRHRRAVIRRDRFADRMVKKAASQKPALSEVSLAEGEEWGRCLCGACRFAAQPVKGGSVCHCEMCRKWTGGMFVATHLARAPRFVADAPLGVYRSSDWGQRLFCANCGASLVWQSRDGVQNYASVQCFDNPGRFAVEKEIFIDEKPAGYALAGDHVTMTGAEVMAAFAPKEES